MGDLFDKKRAFQEGDYFLIEVSEVLPFVWIQLDSFLPKSLIYLKEKNLKYSILFDEEMRQSYHPMLFPGTQHYATVSLRKRKKYIVTAI